jgi:short-subunit dehydrogenase
MDFKQRYGPWAIVAGASEGTGRSFARQIAAEGVSCILIANGGPLEEVADEIRRESGVECVTARIDLSSPAAAEQIVRATGQRDVGLYVSNAGSDANASLYLDCDIEAWLAVVNVNVVTTMQSCHHFGRHMRQRGSGGLLLVNSGACYGGNSYLTIYSAAKGFLLNFAEGLWGELRPHGVHVLSLVLDKTDTPTFRGIQQRLGMPMPSDLASPDDVAKAGLSRLPNGPVHNFGLSDDDPGVMGTPASARRERVLAIDDVVRRLYGKPGAT